MNTHVVCSLVRPFASSLALMLVGCGASAVAPVGASGATSAQAASLSPESYRVTQQAVDEPPFRNAYWNNNAPGIYVDVVSGEPVFSSKEKFDPGTGWPSFYAPLEPSNVRTRRDRAHLSERAEVRSTRGDSHLGHVFEDGPQPTGLRYSINSAALRFIPAARLSLEGYGQYAVLFPEIEQLR